jgi:hypothetical protein
MSSVSSCEANELYEKLWNEWSDGVKLSNLEFLTRLGVCEEKVNAQLLGLDYNDKHSLNKKEFYELMRKIEFYQEFEKNEEKEKFVFSSFEFSQGQDPNEYVSH